jgi:AraC family transcriptional regulator
MKNVTEQDYYERILRTLLYMQQHLDEELELEQLAAVANFSRFHFHRVFHGLVGESLGQHIRRLRLERAAKQLKHGSDSVVQIALQAGFETHEAFTRAFRNMFEISPSDYRTAHKPAPEAPSGAHFDDVQGFHAPAYGDPPQVEVKEIPAMRVVFLRHVGPYSEVGATWSRLMSWAGSRGLLGPSIKTLGIVHDDPAVTPGDKIRYDACLVVGQGVKPEGDFGVQELPGGRYAVATHRGPYENLGQTYQRVYGAWMPKSRHELGNTPAFEQYLNSPESTKPEDLVTVIHVPLEAE